MGQPSGFWIELRRDPRHVTETTLRHTQAQLAPHVQKWWAKTREARPSEPPDRTARRVLRRSTHVARRGGLITGSSFYVGMPSAIAMIYCEQVVLVLRIAAAFGRDPSDPLRAAEFLYLQGRYPTVHSAAAALHDAGSQVVREPLAGDLRTVAGVIRQVPSMIGFRVNRFRARSRIDKVIGGLEVASYFVPVVSLPVWAFANARVTRRLGRSALGFYGQPSEGQGTMPALTLPRRPEPRTRKLTIGTVVPLALAMGALFFFLPLDRYQHGRWIGLAIGEALLALTFARLIRLTWVPKTASRATTTAGNSPLPPFRPGETTR